MATCTQIEQWHQSYIDDALSDSQRVILEEHVSACTACRRSLRTLKRTNALLFETLTDYRLSRDLTVSVLENLPEMEFPAVDVDSLNLRAKYPMRFRERMLRLVPAAAVVLLLALGLVIRDNWPAPAPPYDAVGMVTAVKGSVSHSGKQGPAIVRARVQDFVAAKERFETGSDGVLTISLAGPTTIKLNRESSIEIVDEHNVNIERGQAFFEVAKGQGTFHVYTPTGDVTVYGTAFDVQASPEVTRIVLERGSVRVGHREFSSAFTVLQPGEQVEVVSGLEALDVREADLDSLLAWTKSIQAEESAYAAFQDRIQPRTEQARITADSEFILRNVRGLQVQDLIVFWQAPPDRLDVCGYDVLVFTESEEPFFKGHVEPAVFADRSRHSYVIRGINKTVTGSHNLYVRMVPQCGAESEEVAIHKLEITVKNN